jgi:NADH-quinone oxidoreductase subunit H
MKFSMFFIAEYSHVLTVSMLMATLFLGGWDIPFLQADNMYGVVNGAWLGHAPSVWITLATLVMFGIKTFFFILIFMLVRWTVPRFRYDQVMDLGWKIMLPAALFAVVVTAAAVLALDSFGIEYGWKWAVGLSAVNLPMLAIVLWVMDKGHTLTGTGAVEEKRRIAREAARARAQSRRVPVAVNAQQVR